ncbi:lytic murein transglycosylase [Oceanibium sediminis]|uniref:lytic murein transglycosylase n=1 Tax=Oceanibium sediminis TaxID=2026339 RepID=UPI000DD4A0B8|nr:lytic murein transglycosylase [Oceanibium sediminis]
MTRGVFGALCAAFLIMTPALSGCASASDVRPLVRSDAGDSGVAVAQASSGFQTWREGFRPRAYAAGISARTFDAAFRGITPDPDVIRLDRRQAEFTKAIWEYLDTAVSDARVQNGRGHAQRLSRTLAAIEKTYGVDGEVVLAVWGMETNYGSYRGSNNVIRSLATLAYDGRRRRFAEEQLIAAMQILQSGDVAPSAMKGSWAGAMGHTQFIPTSYLAYAQDFNRDGRRDVWSDDPTDALASTAAYLKRFGWTQGQPWGVEVRLPQGFNYGNIDPKIWRPVSRWTQLGVRGVDGKAVPNYGEASLLAPAGARGPVFMVFKNFNVIKRYNNATSYAMGVGHLAHRIRGGADFQAPWPRNDRALSRNEKVEIQKRLSARGFSTGGADGLIGANTMAAIRDYQRSQGLVPDGYASLGLLKRLRGG